MEPRHAAPFAQLVSQWRNSTRAAASVLSSPDGRWAVVAQGLEAAKPFLKVLVEAQAKLAAQSAKEIADYPVFPPYSDEVYSAVEAASEDELKGVYRIAGKIVLPALRQFADALFGESG